MQYDTVRKFIFKILMVLVPELKALHMSFLPLSYIHTSWGGDAGDRTQDLLCAKQMHYHGATRLAPPYFFGGTQGFHTNLDPQTFFKKILGLGM